MITCNTFSRSILGLNTNLNAVVELDATTTQKFSTHVIMKDFKVARDDGTIHDLRLACSNNGHVGKVVMVFLKFAQEQRHVSGSYADALFVRSAEPHGMRAATLVQQKKKRLLTPLCIPRTTVCGCFSNPNMANSPQCRSFMDHIYFRSIQPIKC